MSLSYLASRPLEQVKTLTRARWKDMPLERGIVVDMRTELMSTLPAILGTEADMREALTNLVFNAIDAMPSGGTVTVRTSVRRSEIVNGVEMVQLEVVDTGIGMTTEETRSRCLEPLFTTKGNWGTGMGLAMVYAAVRRHGGQLTIESSPGAGTTVRICFPSYAHARTLATAAEPPEVPPVAHAMRILVIDDDPLVTKALRDTLVRDGHVVTTARDGETGIALFHDAHQANAPFDAVVTDLAMPHIDGLNVAFAIKALPGSTAVILLTGYGSRLGAADIPPPNVDRVLAKPPQLQALRIALASCAVRRDVL
jgi:CheY-like chemotaxis protein